MSLLGRIPSLFCACTILVLICGVDTNQLILAGSVFQTFSNSFFLSMLKCYHVVILLRLPINGGKNRYSDVLCYDYTRVLLEPSDTCGDYINANHVNGFNQKRGYISCQGPLPKTFDDFWRMVWQEKVRTVVMTTK